MQDTILSLVKRCFYSFKDYILQFIPDSVKITNPSEVVNVFNNLPDVLAKKKKPLFVIELNKTQNDEEFIYNVKLDNFVTVVINVMEKTLDELAKIPDLEPKILSDLYKSMKNETFIKTPIKPRERPHSPNP